MWLWAASTRRGCTLWQSTDNPHTLPCVCGVCRALTVIVCTVIEIVDTLSPYYDIGHARPTLCVATVSIGLLTLKCERNTSLRHHDGLMGTIEASAIELSDVFGLH